MDNIYYVVHNDDTVTYVKADTRVEAERIAGLWNSSEVYWVAPCCDYAIKNTKLHLHSRIYENHQSLLSATDSTVTDKHGVVHDLINESDV